jgi:hypothetical protein
MKDIQGGKKHTSPRPKKKKKKSNQWTNAGGKTASEGKTI